MVHEDLSIAPMHKICKKAGAERGSDSATVELARILHEVGIKIAKEAFDCTMHAGKRTLKARDVKIASSKLFERKMTL